MTPMWKPRSRARRNHSVSSPFRKIFIEEADFIEIGSSYHKRAGDVSGQLLVLALFSCPIGESVQAFIQIADMVGDGVGNFRTGFHKCDLNFQLFFVPTCHRRR